MIRFFQRHIILGSLFIGCIVAGIFYFHHRQNVFRVPSENLWLTTQFNEQDVRSLIEPMIDLKNQTIKYQVESYIDRNAVKFLEQTSNREKFKTIAAQENIPLWGWIIHIEEPFTITIRLSQLKKIVAIDFRNSADKPDINSSWQSLQNLMNKNLGSYSSLDIQQSPNLVETKYQKRILGTDLMENIDIVSENGQLIHVKTELLLPLQYAEHINGTIEKQKTLHLIFNLFHYILVGMVFLIFFQIFETGQLRWKKSFYVYLIYASCLLISNLFKSDLAHRPLFAIFQSLLTTLESSFWIYFLIVVSDFVGRAFHKSKYSLTDIIDRHFIFTWQFRRNVLAGWMIAVLQVWFVFCFYAFFSKFASYIPLKIPGENSIFSNFEFLRYLTEAFTTAFSEETLYRLFFIGAFCLFTKKLRLGVFLAAIFWAFLHFSYQFEPYYVRGLELTVIGILYGYTFIRFGIVSVVTAHFLYNTFVLSEYEHQFEGTFIFANVIIFMAIVISYLFRKKQRAFSFQKASIPSRTRNESAFVERRTFYQRVNPINYKYVIAILTLIIGLSVWLPFHIKPSSPIRPDNSNDQAIQLIHMFSKDPYWSVDYIHKNSSIENLEDYFQRHGGLDSQTKKEAEMYSDVWTTRFFSKTNHSVLCDFDYSMENELLSMYCPNPGNSAPQTVSFWINQLKTIDEAWIPIQSDASHFLFQIENRNLENLQFRGSLYFENGNLVSFKKQLQPKSVIGVERDNHSTSPYINVVLAIVFVIFVTCFSLTMISCLKKFKFYDTKSFYGALTSFVLYGLWQLNCYRETLVTFNPKISIGHFLTNHALILGGTMLILACVSYLLFYSFFRFPHEVFDVVPTSDQWTRILSRPIWKWRNARASILYALLLISIRILFGFFEQITQNTSNFEVFSFDLSYINHQYLLITFLCTLWKNLMIWMLLLVVVSALEKNLPRLVCWIILIATIVTNTILSGDSGQTKIIEMLSMLTLFYFVYRIIGFDFAFYFWFIVFNSLTAFLPILLDVHFQALSQQIYFVFVTIVMIALFTIFGTKPRLKDASRGQVV